MAGMKETLHMAEQGMASFAKEDQFNFDTAGATAYKDGHDAAIKAKEAEAEALTGKDNKKARSEISKQAGAMKLDKKYIDACKVLKGLPAPNGNFMTKVDTEADNKKSATAEPEKEAKDQIDDKDKKAKKEEKKPKKTESAGISKAERDELEKLKTDIIAKKGELKAQGLSGGACNKDPDVVQMVARMQELKIKEDPSLADPSKKKENAKAEKKAETEDKTKLKEKIEEYRMQLKTEFGYTDKEIKADPDMQDMTKALAKLK